MPGDSLCLAIETSNPSADPAVPGEVALARCANWADPDAPVQVLACERLAPKARHDDALAPAIDRLFTTSRCKPAALARVAVSVGPGGYSALRIAVATARMIAEATGASCVPVETAAVAAECPDLPPRFAVLLASKRETVWAAVYERPTPPKAPREFARGRLVDVAGLLDLRREAPFDAILADGHLPEPFRLVAATAGLASIPLRLTALALLEASRARAGLAPDALFPLYPREAEAVRKWRELGRASRP